MNHRKCSKALCPVVTFEQLEQLTVIEDMPLSMRRRRADIARGNRFVSKPQTKAERRAEKNYLNRFGLDHGMVMSAQELSRYSSRPNNCTEADSEFAERFNKNANSCAVSRTVRDLQGHKAFVNFRVDFDMWKWPQGFNAELPKDWHKFSTLPQRKRIEISFESFHYLLFEMLPRLGYSLDGMIEGHPRESSFYEISCVLAWMTLGYCFHASGKPVQVAKYALAMYTNVYVDPKAFASLEHPLFRYVEHLLRHPASSYFYEASTLRWTANYPYSPGGFDIKLNPIELRTRAMWMDYKEAKYYRKTTTTPFANVLECMQPQVIAFKPNVYSREAMDRLVTNYPQLLQLKSRPKYPLCKDEPWEAQTNGWIFKQSLMTMLWDTIKSGVTFVLDRALKVNLGKFIMDTGGAIKKAIVDTLCAIKEKILQLKGWCLEKVGEFQQYLSTFAFSLGTFLENLGSDAKIYMSYVSKVLGFGKTEPVSDDVVSSSEESDNVDLNFMTEVPEAHIDIGTSGAAAILTFAFQAAAYVKECQWSSSSKDPLPSIVKFFKEVPYISRGMDVSSQAIKSVFGAVYFYVTGNCLYDSDQLAMRIEAAANELLKIEIIVSSFNPGATFPADLIVRIATLNAQLKLLMAETVLKPRGETAAMHKLLESSLKKGLLLANLALHRIIPISILIHGDSGIGKTETAETLPSDILYEFRALCRASKCSDPFEGVDAASSYLPVDCTLEKKYFEGYHNQFAIHLNEIFSCQRTDINVFWSGVFQSWCDKVPQDIPMAAVENKGTTFMTSSVVIGTTNAQDPTFNTVSRTAFARRVDFHVNASSKREEGSTPWTHIRYKVHDLSLEHVNGSHNVQVHSMFHKCHVDPSRSFTYMDLVRMASNLLFERIHCSKSKERTPWDLLKNAIPSQLSLRAKGIEDLTAALRAPVFDPTQTTTSTVFDSVSAFIPYGDQSVTHNPVPQAFYGWNETDDLLYGEIYLGGRILTARYCLVEDKVKNPALLGILSKCSPEEIEMHARATNDFESCYPICLDDQGCLDFGTTFFEIYDDLIRNKLIRHVVAPGMDKFDPTFHFQYDESVAKHLIPLFNDTIAYHKYCDDLTDMDKMQLNPKINFGNMCPVYDERCKLKEKRGTCIVSDLESEEMPDDDQSMLEKLKAKISELRSIPDLTLQKVETMATLSAIATKKGSNTHTDVLVGVVDQLRAYKLSSEKYKRSHDVVEFYKRNAHIADDAAAQHSLPVRLWKKYVKGYRFDEGRIIDTASQYSIKVPQPILPWVPAWVPILSATRDIFVDSSDLRYVRTTATRFTPWTYSELYGVSMLGGPLTLDDTWKSRIVRYLLDNYSTDYVTVICSLIFYNKPLHQFFAKLCQPYDIKGANVLPSHIRYALQSFTELAFPSEASYATFDEFVANIKSASMLSLMAFLYRLYQGKTVVQYDESVVVNRLRAVVRGTDLMAVAIVDPVIKDIYLALRSIVLAELFVLAGDFLEYTQVITPEIRNANVAPFYKFYLESGAMRAIDIPTRALTEQSANEKSDFYSLYNLRSFMTPENIGFVVAASSALALVVAGAVGMSRSSTTSAHLATAGSKEEYDSSRNAFVRKMEKQAIVRAVPKAVTDALSQPTAHSPGDHDLLQVFAANTYIIYGTLPGSPQMARRGLLTFMKDNVAEFSRHIWTSTMSTFVLYSPVTHSVVTYQKAGMRLLYAPADRDIVYVQIFSSRIHRDLWKHTMPRKRMLKYRGSNLTHYFDFKDEAHTPAHVEQLSFSWGTAGPIVVSQMNLSYSPKPNDPSVPTTDISLQYRSEQRASKPGDSGGPVAMEFDGSMRLIASHACGYASAARPWGMAPIFSEDYDAIMAAQDTVLKDMELHMLGDDPSGASTLDTHTQEFTTPVSTSSTNVTSFVPSPLNQADFPYPVEKHPARLGNQARLNSLEKSRNACTLSRVPAPEALATVLEHKDALMDDFFDGAQPSSDMKQNDFLTPEDAIWGNPDLGIDPMDFTTADGIRLKHMGYTKEQLRDPDSEASQAVLNYIKGVWALMLTGVFPFIISALCLKDECRPTERVRTHSTRMFCVTDFIDNVLLKMILGSFVTKLKKTLGTHRSSCGVTPGTAEWARMYRTFSQAVHGIVCGDIRSSDMVLNPTWAYVIVPWLWKFYPQCAYDRRARQIITWAIRACFESVRFDRGKGEIWSMGIPSGCWITTALTIWCNHVLHRVCFIHILKDNFDPDPFSNSRDVIARFYGDDNISFSSNPLWTLPNFSDMAMRLFQITITDAMKRVGDQRNLDISEIDYLSRKFVPHELNPSIIQAPLALPNLLSQLFYVRKPKAQTLDTSAINIQLQINLDNVVEELYEHEREVASEVYNNIARYIHEKRLPLTMRRFDYEAGFRNIVAVNT